MPNRTDTKQIPQNFPSFLSVLSSDLPCVTALILCTVIAAFTIDISSLSSSAHSLSPSSTAAFLNIALLVVAYMIIVKSNPEVSNMPLSFLISFISIIMNTFSCNFSLLNLPFCLMVPSLVLWLTKSYQHCIISLFIQLINILLLFRNNIEEAIKIMTNQELTERITQCLTLGSLIVTFSFAYVFYSKEVNKVNEMFSFPIKSKDSQKYVLFNSENLLTLFINEAETSIQNILGSLDLLLSHIEPGLGAKLLKIAKTSTEELKRILCNLIEVNKGEKQSINNSPTCVRTLFKSVWENITLLIQKEGLDGTLKIDGDIPESLEVDSDKVKLIALNLVNFFLQRMNKGSINLTIEYAKQALIEDDDILSDYDISTSELTSFISSMPQSEEISTIFGYFKTISTPTKPKTNNKIERMLKITIKNFEETPLKKIEDCYCETELKDFPSWISSDMAKLSLCLSQKMCEDLGGNMKIYERKDNETAFIVNIPAGVLAVDRFKHRRWNKDL